MSDRDIKKLLKACKTAEQALKDIINASDNGQPYSAQELQKDFMSDLGEIQEAIEYGERCLNDTIYLEWCVEDVTQRAKETGIELTEEQAKDVLSLMESEHDCTIGMSWEVMDVWIDHVLEKSKE